MVPEDLPSTARGCGAVVVCFNPPPGLAGRLAVLATQVRRLVVVDNGPAEQHPALLASLGGLPNLQVIANPRNAGIATALNQGLRALAAEGLGWGLILDHDSTPRADMLPRLLQAAQDGSAAGGALYVPRIHYALPEMVCRWPVTRPGHRYRFRRIAYSQMSQPTAVDLAISSGMLVNLGRFQQLGGFRDDLFIDLVDTEYCLRARARGLAVVAVPDAVLEHCLGDAQRRNLAGLPVYPTFHGARRHYFICRNRVHLYRMYGRRFPSWAIYETLSGIKLLIKVLLFESGRREKLVASVRGTLDGLRNRYGGYPGA